MDPETRAFYDRQAVDYAAYSGAKTDQTWLTRFAEGVPLGGRVLDFGCGSAWAAAWLAGQGYRVEALDGSAGLAEEARRRFGIAVRLAEFGEFTDREAFNGIWASFCLLHSERAEIGGHIARLAAALVPGGLLYLGMKEGTGEARDDLGRRYTYVSETELAAWIAQAGLVGAEILHETRPGYTGKTERFLHAYARRPERRNG